MYENTQANEIIKYEKQHGLNFENENENPWLISLCCMKHRAAMRRLGDRISYL